MVKNYINIAWRNLKKNKIDSIISIGGLALLIALATVSWQSIRAALANPVDSLQSE